MSGKLQEIYISSYSIVNSIHYITTLHNLNRHLIYTCVDLGTTLLVAMAPFGSSHAAVRQVRRCRFRNSRHATRNSFPRGFRCHIYSATYILIYQSINLSINQFYYRMRCFTDCLKLFMSIFNSFQVNFISRIFKLRDILIGD